MPSYWKKFELELIKHLDIIENINTFLALLVRITLNDDVGTDRKQFVILFISILYNILSIIIINANLLSNVCDSNH